MIEQRKHRRFELHLPVEVVRKGDGTVNGSGETMNMSAGGVLFTTSTGIQVGEHIEYIITFPTGPINGGGVSLRCLGKVTRLDSGSSEMKDEGPTVSVAATLERYEFVRKDK